MRPNLSIERLALTLAALGTTAVLSACGGAAPQSAAPPPPPEATPDESKKSEGEKPDPKRRPSDKGGTGQASCGAGTCTADPKKK